jgi:CRP-like cAMP-binding protein
MDRSSSSQSLQNRLLGLLSEADLALLRPHLRHVTFAYKLALCEAYKPISFVYFPTSGVVSMVNTMADGSAAEVGTIGNEGMVGLPILLGNSSGPTNVYVQVPGAGLRLRSELLRNGLERSSSMRSVMLRYADAMFNQVAQMAACNHFHSIEQRCCRWLLMTHDRVQSEKFLLTQEFLGMMLGARRSSVTLAASDLKARKLIDYHRGHVTILDRAGLEKGSCECYAMSRRAFDLLLGPPHSVLPESAPLAPNKSAARASGKNPPRDPSDRRPSAAARGARR